MRNQLCRKRRAGGTALVELTIGLVLSSMLLVMTASLWVYGIRSLAITGNYAGRDANSRNAFHLRTRDLRPATQATGFQNSRNTKGFRVTNAAEGNSTSFTPGSLSAGKAVGGFRPRIHFQGRPLE
jgi:Tfp pilus assembly protein PilW